MRKSALSLGVATSAVLASGLLAQAAEPYPSLAPIAELLMSDRSAEVALARSAAPPAVARDAAVLVFEKTGHVKAVEGSNGFVFAVMRSWGGPAEVGGKPFPDFWNPKVRAPICFNPQAARSALPVYLRKTELALAGRSRSEILQAIDRGYGDGSLRPPHPSSMAYMMSREQFLGDGVQHFRPHLMLYAPYATAADWSGGARLKEVFVGEHEGDPQSIVIVSMPSWSDGSPAAAHP